MPKVKISEYSATANSNTDVASINIDEGCAPSGINNAIRAVMGHLKDFQQGTNGDPFNGPVNGTLGATTPSTASVTTLTTSSTITHNGGTANGVAYLNGSKVLTTGSALVFDGSNLGVGVTPSTWSTGKAIQVGTLQAAIWGAGDQIDISGNAYFNSGWKAAATKAGASLYEQALGVHSWSVSGAVTAGNAITFTQAMTLDASGNLGVGVTAPQNKLQVVTTTRPQFSVSYNGTTGLYLEDATVSSWKSWKLSTSFGAGSDLSFVQSTNTSGTPTWAASAAMTLDASGNLLLGTTTSPSGSGRLAVGAGAWEPNTGYFQLTPKYTSGTASYYLYDTTSGFFSLPDNANPLGNASYRWTTVYATTGTINTSDANEKQDIASLDDAEKRVAVAIKSLIKKYRFKDAVVKKGNDARIHIGAVAQDVQAAFVAEGLDPTRYALFCSDTWYEVDGKAKPKEGDFYTSKTPNAVEVTRLGLRYEELLAFVIAAM